MCARVHECVCVVLMTQLTGRIVHLEREVIVRQLIEPREYGSHTGRTE